MTDGVFRRLKSCAYARATQVMSTESSTKFSWAVKLIGDTHFRIGIASEPELTTMIGNKCEEIYDYDGNAIIYELHNIRVGNNVIFSNVSRQATGDIIYFTFEPDKKRLVIELVSV